MKTIQKHRKLFLYSGLSILAVSFIVKWTGAPLYYFHILLCTAIVLKMLFLIAVVSIKGFKPGLWFYFILAGVAMILISMLFKTAFPILYKILFYGAIALKTAGLILMILHKKN
ncbi:MAG: hypothetical protein LBS69_02870 [Prevotellaceae bacterium]|jgi:hypothetical protein|nr:hypothetical protein [Prevotellaceae bacterium]